MSGAEIDVRAGDWVLFRSDASYDRVAVDLKQASKVTPRLVKFEGGHPRQCSRIGVVAAFASYDDARRGKDSIAGIAGEFARRRRIAEDEKSAKITAALQAAEKQIAASFSRLHRTSGEGGE